MKYIALTAVFGILLLQASGAVAPSSVGGSMTIGLAILVAILAVGIHEAWTKGRGVLGWILSIVVALVGAFVAAEVGDLVLVGILLLLDLTGLLAAMGSLNGSLAATGGPLIYLGLAGMTLFILMGSWAALRIVSRWR